MALQVGSVVFSPDGKGGIVLHSGDDGYGVGWFASVEKVSPDPTDGLGLGEGPPPAVTAPAAVPIAAVAGGPAVDPAALATAVTQAVLAALAAPTAVAAPVIETV